MQRPVWHFQAEEIPKGRGEHGHWCSLPSVLALSTIPVGATGQKALPWPKGLIGPRGTQGVLTLVPCSSWAQCGCGIQQQWCRVAGSAQSVTGPLYSQMSLEMDSPGWDGCPQLGRMSQGGFKGPFLKVPLHIWHLPCGQSPPCCWESPQPPFAVPCESCFPSSARQRQSRHARECLLSTPKLLSVSHVGIHQ